MPLPECTLPQQTSSSLESIHTTRLAHIAKLQQDFDLEVHRETNQENSISSYNIVLDRANFELDVHTPEEYNAYRSYVEYQMITNLKERHHVVSSTFRLPIKNGKLYAEHYDTEPLEHIYQRGVQYRKKHGSHEQKREQKEYEGFCVQQRFFCNSETTSGSRLIVISPPGQQENTEYTKNFVDILELREDKSTGEKTVHATRYTTQLSIDQYKERSSLLDMPFQEQGISPDAWFLSHPLPIPETYSHLSSDQIYEKIFCGDPSAMKDHEFSDIVYTSAMKHAIRRYVDICTQQHADWRTLAKTFNGVLNYSDYLVEESRKKKISHEQQTWQRIVFDRYEPLQQRLASDPDILIEYWGRQAVRAVSAGCGSSSGYSIGGWQSIGVSQSLGVESSVAKYGISGSEGIDYKDDPNLCRCGGREPHFHCPGKNGTCNHAIVVGQGITRCPSCGQGKTC